MWFTVLDNGNKILVVYYPAPVSPTLLFCHCERSAAISSYQYHGQTVSAAYSGHILKHKIQRRFDNGIAIPTSQSLLTGLASLYQ